MTDPAAVLRRRLTVFALAALLIAGIIVAVKLSFFSAEPQQNAADSPHASGHSETVAVPETESSEQPDSSTEVAQQETSAQEQSTTGVETDKQTREPLQSAGLCADTDIRLKVRPAQGIFEQGSRPEFYATVQNTSEVACDRDLSGSELVWEVFPIDSAAKLWSSKDCLPTSQPEMETLQPGEEKTRRIVWSLTSSSPQACGLDQRIEIAPGYYQVFALTAGVISAPQPFNIVAAN